MNLFNDFFHQRYSIITIIIFLVIGFFSLIPINCLFLDPLTKAISDFDIYDIVYSNLREQQKADTNIVLVNIGNLSRKEIAEQISIISQYKPRVIGIDAIFEEEKNTKEDSVLAAAFARIKNLVLVNKVYSYDEENDIYDSVKFSIDKFNSYASNGFANLPNDNELNFRTIREFRHAVNSGDGKVLSFASRIVSLSDSSAYKKLNERDRELEKINFVGNYDKFYFLDAKQLSEKNNDLNFLKDKIVLFGFMGLNFNTQTFEDIYFTPINQRYAGKSFPDMYGVVIHANIISMILTGNYINEMPQWLNIIISILICYMNVFIIYNLKIKYKDWFGAFSKTLILILMLLLLAVSIIVLHNYNYRFNLTLIFVSLVVTSTVVEVYINYLTKLFPNIEKSFRANIEIENSL